MGTVDLLRVVHPSELERFPPLVGEALPGDYLWEFADAVEIEPVAVGGNQNLWTLPAAAALAVAEAEARARDVEPAPHRGPVVAARDGYWIRLGHGLDEKESEGGRLFPGGQFADASFERLISRVLDRYLSEHQQRGTGPGAEVHIDHRLPGLAPLFGSREWVPRTEFERTVRHYLWLNADAELRRSGGGRGREYDDFSAAEDLGSLSSYFERDDGRVVETRSPDDRRRRRMWRRG